MFTLKFSPEIQAAAPGLQVLTITADIDNPPTPDELWAEITATAARVHDSYEMSWVNKRPAIAATREAYKACGKEPNRYRPSSEALMRRMVKEMDLYRSLAVIDLINLLSVACGHSIGGFDADRIEGDVLTLGVGCEGEPYEAIGRGQLNIAGMPVWRDAVGGIGTPTSDNDRTKLSADTKRLLMIVNMYGQEMPLSDIRQLAERLLCDYAKAENIRFNLHTPNTPDPCPL